MIRQAAPSDLPQILSIYATAREFMRQNGNPTQWPDHYPSREMLHTLKKHDARLILSSDSHRADTIDFAFEEAKLILKDVGFTHVYTFLDGQFVKDPLY